MGANKQGNKAIMRRRRIYHHTKRTLLPLLAGLCVFLLAKNGLFPSPPDNRAIPAFIVYVLVGLFYDWFIFTYRGYKDSTDIDPEELKSIDNVPVNDVDTLNDFYVMVRRAAALVSVSSAAICLLSFPNASLMGTAFLTYCGVTVLLISIGVSKKKIIFKYTPKNILETDEDENEEFFRRQATFDITSDNPSLNPDSWYHRK